MRIGLVIVTYNRPNYLSQCLESLNRADIPKGTIIHFEEAGSDDKSVIDQIIKFQGTNQNPFFTTGFRRRITECLLHGIEFLFNQGCDIVINLDSDAIVRNDFIYRILEVLEIGANLPTKKVIATGFNSITTTRNGIPRHPIDGSGQGWNTKTLIGGINMCFTKMTYEAFIKPALIKCKTIGNWDTEASRLAGGAISTVPSVIQHIGLDSTMGHTDNPDVATDFLPVAPIKSTEITVKSALEQSESTLHTGKILFVEQYFGIGDVIFSVQLVRNLMKQGYKCLWPVAPEFVEACNKAYSDITFVDFSLFPRQWFDNKEDKTTGSTRFLPIRWTYDIMKVPFKDCMRSKYDFMGMIWQDWRKSMFERDEVKETALMHILGITEKDEYCLINRTFKTNQQGKVLIQPQTNLKTVEMRQIPGFSIFDWTKVIENASEIHTVSTSIIYIMELIDLKCVPNIYIRRPDERNHENYDYIMTKHKYNFMP